MAAKSYEDLEVWRKVHQLVLDVYRVSRAFPREEIYALTSQVRRAAASVAANIVEGFRRPTKADKARFYQIALASLDETHYHLRLAHDLGYADTVSLRAAYDEAGRMLNAYTRAVVGSDRSDGRARTYGLIGIMFAGLSYFISSLLASRF
jgi:four helix bundle protein